MAFWRMFTFLAALLCVVGLHATSACIVPSPRDLTGGASLIIVGTATSPTSWRIDQVLYGTATVSSELRAGDANVNACFDIIPGERYLVCEQRGSGTHAFSIRRLEEAADDLAYLSRRHFVERGEVLDALDRFARGELATARFRRWIETADTLDSERNESVTVHIIENLELVAEDFERLERLDPDLARRFRSGPLRRMLETLQAFPQVENERETYRALNDTLTAMWKSPEWTTAAEILWRDYKY